MKWLARPRKKLLVSIDWVDVPQLHCLVLAARLRGRALPLLWAVGLHALAHGHPRQWCSNNRPESCSLFTIGRIMLGRLKLAAPRLMSDGRSSVQTGDRSGPKDLDRLGRKRYRTFLSRHGARSCWPGDAEMFPTGSHQRRGRQLSKRTVLYDRHVALGGRMVDFHGWALPVQYEGILAEHRHCRSSACLFDTSHMGQIIIRTGDPQAVSRVTTQDAAGLKVGRAKYGFLLNEAGGIIDDTVLMRLADGEFMLVVNAATASGDFEWLSGHLRRKAELIDQSAAGWGKVDLQGPLAGQVLAGLTDADLRDLGYFQVTRAAVCGRQCILSRTGYTGELGYEIYAPGETISDIFDEILADGRVKPAGLGARDSLRLEMCYPLHGQDIHDQVNPLEADLGSFLESRHEYIGSAALARIAETGPARKLIAFTTRGRRRARPGDEIRHAGQASGTVTSAAFAPSLDVSIGMGYVASRLAEPGTAVTIAGARAEIPAVVADKPIYKQGTCRTKEIL